MAIRSLHNKYVSMIAGLMVLAATCLSVRAADTPTTVPAKQAGKIRIVLAGDSTVTDHAGWGLGFAEQLQGNIECINESSGGQSTKSYTTRGLFEKCLKLQPDYVLIQFGHNDQPGKGPDRETDPKTTYYQNMKRFVEEARAAGAQPVLVTSLSRREFQKDGKIHSSLEPYVAAVKELAADEKVPLIDLHSLSIALYEKIGPAECNKISPIDSRDATKFDGTHLNHEGGEEIGTMVAEALVKAVPELSQYVKAVPEPAKHASAAQ